MVNSCPPFRTPPTATTAATLFANANLRARKLKQRSRNALHKALMLQKYTGLPMMIPATLAAPSFSATAGKSSFSPGSSGRPTATWAGILRPANSISSTSMRSGSTAFAASRQTCSAWAVVLPARTASHRDDFQLPGFLVALREAGVSGCRRHGRRGNRRTCSEKPSSRYVSSHDGSPCGGAQPPDGTRRCRNSQVPSGGQDLQGQQTQLPRPRPAGGTCGSSVRPLTSTASECQRRWPPCRRSSLHHRSPGPASSSRRSR